MFIGEEGVDGEFGGQQRIIKENRHQIIPPLFPQLAN